MSSTRTATRIATMPLGATFFDQTCFPYLDGYPDDYADLPQVMAQDPLGRPGAQPVGPCRRGRFLGAAARQGALACAQHTDRALMIVVGCNLFEWGTFLRRMDNFLMDLVTEPGEVERLLDALMEQHLQTLEKVCARRRRRGRHRPLRRRPGHRHRARSCRPRPTASSSSRATQILSDYVQAAQPACTPSCTRAARSTSCCPT